VRIGKTPKIALVASIKRQVRCGALDRSW
jgi:hypothetical protein